ncbi:protein NRT1/ PTR FAMILY 5.7-like [Telopea speciosissima]|uniref:protein NRT1/ PTR FAMILY 5.7-like n=1 Tax=Telopea speciosissima TaxID=54955 RepID=UPI001CC4F12F|nr:protein NRT1/ PTR FAMILY 5.7-like [Telopea speciosissima]
MSIITKPYLIVSSIRAMNTLIAIVIKSEVAIGDITNAFIWFPFDSGVRQDARKYVATIGVGSGMIISIFCCIHAAKVEFLLLGVFDGLAREGFQNFFGDQVSASMKAYINSFVEAVFGVGIIFSVLFVYVTNKVSEMGGRQGWFQFILNQSRLDNYYWTLAVLSTINLVLFVFIACYFPYKDAEIEDEQL